MELLVLIADFAAALPMGLSFELVTAGKKHDVRVAPHIRFALGTTPVFARDFAETERLLALMQQKVCFATHRKQMKTTGRRRTGRSAAKPGDSPSLL